VVRQGPIPAWLHGLLEYLAAIALIVAPFVLAFQSGAAIAVSIVSGVVLLVLAATSAGPTSIVDQLPVSVHILLDYVFAAFLIASPFLFGFSAETNPTAFFMALGVVHLLDTIGTRFLAPKDGAAAPVGDAPSAPQARTR
jgi:hypothetical protein